MEATQVKTEEAVQAPGKKEPPKLKVPKKRKMAQATDYRGGSAGGHFLILSGP